MTYLSERTSPLETRDNFGKFLQSKNLLGMAVEVGTHQGAFADKLFSHWQGDHLFCIDSWKSNYDKSDPASEGSRKSDYEQTLNILKRYGDKITILKLSSLVAVNLFKDNSLDFVYIDACHQADSVLEDLTIWWPKIKVGGLLSGHDIRSAGHPGNGWDRFIRPIVNQFAVDHQIPLWIVKEERMINWSYYMEKP